ncbi:MAG: hypothetical protein ACPGSM_17300, partial [Thiolinea sp.]
MADKAFINGQVITINPDDQITEAILIKDRTIAAVGTTAEINALLTPETEVIDLGGRSLVPGFIDA